jgi:hypothetical protein
MAVESETKVFSIARPSSSGLWFVAALSGLPLLIVLIVALTALRPEKVWLDVERDGLRVSGSMYGRLIANPDATLARRLTANDTPGYWPKLRTNGIGLPNYLAGWFRLENGEKALLFVSDWSRTVLVPTHEDYVLIASPGDADGFLAALQAQKPAPEVSRISEPERFPLAPAAATSIRSWAPLLGGVGAVTVSIAVVLTALLFAGRGGQFEVSPEGLRIRGPYGKLIPRDAMDVKAARAVDPAKDTAYRLQLRTNGIGMPGYSAGWFRLKGGAKALVFLTDRRRAIAIPTNLGYSVIVSPAEPEQFLAALRG